MMFTGPVIRGCIAVKAFSVGTAPHNLQNVWSFFPGEQKGHLDHIFHKISEETETIFKNLISTSLLICFSLTQKRPGGRSEDPKGLLFFSLRKILQL